MEAKGDGCACSHLLLVSDVEVVSTGKEPVRADQEGSSSDLFILKLDLKHSDAGVWIFIKGRLRSVIYHLAIESVVACLMTKFWISDMTGQEIVLIEMHLRRSTPF